MYLIHKSSETVLASSKPLHMWFGCNRTHIHDQWLAALIKVTNSMLYSSGVCCNTKHQVLISVQTVNDIFSRHFHETFALKNKKFIDLTFLSMQDDQVVLQCTATILKEQIKLCLSCEGFGNRLCFLETTSNAQVQCTAFLCASFLRLKISSLA